MTPEKAIEILQLDKAGEFEGDIADRKGALQFGIEAIEQLVGVRIGNTVPGSKLPSEESK